MELPELRQLKCFSAVAEHLHFGRAAQALTVEGERLGAAAQEFVAQARRLAG